MRTTNDKLKLFAERFTGLTQVYGTYAPDTGKAWQVKKPVERRVFLDHLTGRQPYGVYLLTGDRTGAIAVDFDEPDPELPRGFVQFAGSHGLSAYVERSKSKGHHVWIFFEGNGVPASKARRVVRHLLVELEQPNVEVFPKQDVLDTNVSFGNFINAPLFGLLVPRGRTVFVDPANSMEPFADQWEFLEQVEPVGEDKLDAVIQALQPAQPAASGLAPEVKSSSADTTGKQRFIPRTGLPICAQRMLNDGVSTNQRVSCFRLAVHFNRLGIPWDIAVAALLAWAAKNRPRNGKGQITDQEVREQADAAYKRGYRGFGCDDPAVRPFCAQECPLWWKHQRKAVPMQEPRSSVIEGAQ